MVRRTDHNGAVDGMTVRFRIVAEYEFEVSNGFELRATRQRFDDVTAPRATSDGGKLVQLATECVTASGSVDRKELEL